MALDEVLGRLGPTAKTVLIDGRSGSGKSTLALQLQENWADSVVVRLDDIYPGWDGLSWAADHVQQSLLQPRAAGSPGIGGSGIGLPPLRRVCIRSSPGNASSSRASARSPRPPVPWRI
ncbi:hypothetical protein [Mycolicibacterium sp.]|uniref:hypothetical protein n=1 Tax=Mycolicibacterium sp. TaxID=2320850 RepID=UPI0037CC0468